jgi:ParB/RepB/Spo0J family partition protein
MNAQAPTEPALVAVPLEQISLGKNYRHRRPSNWEQKLDELGASMKQNGQLEPVLLRPAETTEVGEYQVVFGERRYRAAKKAGLETLLAIVRDVSDDQVLELQVEENNQREEPHPLDEAEGFAELVQRGRTVGQIAERLGRDPSYVAKRLALLQLGKEVKEAFDDERITFSVALLLARVPDKKIQAEALESVLQDSYDGLMPAEQVRKLIEDEFMLRLEKAPFDRADAALVAKAGPCTTCPKRTGTQHELFAEFKSPDLCTDAACYRQKLDALWQIKKKEAKAGGTGVLEGKDARDALRRGGSGKYQKLDDQVLVGFKMVDVRKVLGKDKPPVTLARDDDTGAVFEVVPSADVRKAVREKKGAHDEELAGRSKSYDQREAAQQKKLKLRRQAIRIAVAKAVELSGKAKPDALFELLARAFAARAWNEVQVRILERRGVSTKGTVENALMKLVHEAGDDLHGIGLELALWSGAPWHGSGNLSEVWRDGLKLVGVNFEAIEKEVTAAAKAGKKKGAKEKVSRPRPKAKKAAKKKGRKS